MMILEAKKIKKTATNSLVLFSGDERVIHRFVKGGSRVEYCVVLNGKPYGSPTVYVAKHDDKTTPNDVLNHIGLTQFVKH